MKKLYFKVFCCFILTFTALLPKNIFAQACSTLTATYITTESRCAATGTVQINATGGSGNYQYKATGPVIINYTSSSLITGLLPGSYLITVKDVVTNCIYANDSITIAGDYVAPNFTMASTDVTCINGNDGIITVTGQTFGRAPFLYKIIAPSASGVGTVSPAGIFTGLISGNYLIQLTDSCGAIQTRNVTILNYDWWINNYTVTKTGCDSISVTINLKDSKGNGTPNPVFNGFLYGALINPGDTTWFTTNTFKYYKGNKHTVKLFVKDGCGNIKSVVWTDSAVPNVNASVSISNKICLTFTATVTGQVNLTAPSYCIYNSSNVLISCNTTGIFNLLPYGNYCITITDNCYDTTITRCFTVKTPVPSVGVNVNISTDCKWFTATVTGQTNLNNPYYCLYDSADILMYCDSTGSFGNLPFGRYCIKIFNDPACYDTTIIRCFTVNRPVPSVGLNVTIINLTCSTFTAVIGDTANLNDPQYCLFTAKGVLIICNNTGVFDNLPYGSYCINVINDASCYDTTITRCFTVTRPIPSVGATVSVSNKTCTSFTATITGQVNISNPQYCIYDSADILMSCNATGVFASLPYGSYCIKTQNDPACYDTLITRCFTAAPTITRISLTSKKSCTTIGTTDLKVTINAGIPAYTIMLFSPAGILMQSITTGSSSYTFLNIPALPAPQRYKIIVTDQCGSKDSISIVPVVSIVNRVITITPKCPSGIWPDGSADVLISITTNIGGNIIPKIIKKNLVPVSINASSNIGFNYTFLNLGPATYVFDTYIENCGKHVYDTVEVRIYLFPILSGSNAYQCDNNGFSVSANVLAGMAPFTYEIIGSVPSSPSIVTPPQTSSVFSINNGTIYSLVRLRVVDGCGNASLYDVSVLPLANFIVTLDSPQCFNHGLRLWVDSIANAVYTWYKRIEPNDSVIVGTGPSYYIANLLPSDTGRYFCRIVVNNGCLIRYANYIITGQCYSVLPNDIKLLGTKQTDGNKLYWNKGELNIKEYTLQRSSATNANYQPVYSTGNTSGGTYSFLDKNPFTGNNYYRLKFTTADNQIKYSNIIAIKNTKFTISFYPNPVSSVLYILVSNKLPKNYAVEIRNMAGQKIMYKLYYNIQNTVISCDRNAGISNGLYIVTVTDLQNNQKETYKITYK